MHVSSLLLAALAGQAVAYTEVANMIASKQQAAKRQGVTFPDPNTGFNAKQQYVSTSGKHKFIPPNFETDARGPCPGLNAMANHGYLPRNGVGNDEDFIKGTFEAFGMGADLSGFLTVLGSTIDGDGTKWSIGGINKAVPAPAPGLGTPQGISGSHNKYESDISPGRGDLYTAGNDYRLQMDQFTQLYELGQENGDNIDLNVMDKFRNMRFKHQVETNPYLFLGPFTGVLVAPAAFEFIYRFMGNKSAEYPQGKLNTAILMDFFGVTKKANGKLVKKDGYERFPENWYKRAIGDEYTIPLLNSDTTLAAKKYPKFLSIGGNLGKPNTFVGLDIENLTSGALNSQTILEGNNLACFSMDFAAQTAPDVLKCSQPAAAITGLLAKLNSQLAKSVAGLDCKPLAKLSTTQFKQFPGYSKLKCDGTY